MMSRAHGQQELPCNSWVGKFLRNSGQCLNIKRQVGVLLWEHREWILRMASLYKTDIRQSDVRPEACGASFQTRRTQNICMLSHT